MPSVLGFAPDGRRLSPGEVFVTETEPPKPEVWRKDLSIELICPNCQERPPNLTENMSSGDTICASCGHVLAEHLIDTRSEWRTFSNDDQNNDDPSRVGDAANPLLHGAQLQTQIAFGDGKMRTRELARAQNKSTHDKANKTLMAAYKNISTLCESQNISHTVADTAKHLFKMTEDAKVLKGKSQDAVIAGCIFIACRTNDVPRSFREIFKLTNVSKKEIGRIYKQLETFIGHKQKAGASLAGGAGLNTDDLTAKKNHGAHNLIPRACDKLDLPTSIAIIAQDVAKRVEDDGVAAGRSPLSIGGACLYMVSHLMGQPRTPKEIGGAVDVSDGTIRTAYKIIYTRRFAVIADEWKEKGADFARLPHV